MSEMTDSLYAANWLFNSSFVLVPKSAIALSTSDLVIGFLSTSASTSSRNVSSPNFDLPPLPITEVFFDRVLAFNGNCLTSKSFNPASFKN